MAEVSCEIALRWLSLNLADINSAVGQVMAWSRGPQATLQSITFNVDPNLRCHMASLGHNDP